MTENCFKPIKKWLLIGCMLSFPYFQANASSSDLEDINTNFAEKITADSSLVSAKNSNAKSFDAIQSTFRVLFVNQAVFFHDYTFALLETLPISFVEANYNLLNQNTTNFTTALSQFNPVFADEFSVLLKNYLIAGENYVLSLQSTLNPDAPVVTANLQTWIANANLIAAFFKNSNSKIDLQYAQTILISYTNFLAATAINLVPTTVNNPNFTAASALYARAREIASNELPLLILKAALPRKAHHHHRHRFDC